MRGFRVFGVGLRVFGFRLRRWGSFGVIGLGGPPKLSNPLNYETLKSARSSSCTPLPLEDGETVWGLGSKGFRLVL